MRINEYYQHVGYARLDPSLTGMTTSWNSPTKYYGYATFDPSPFVSEFDKAKNTIQAAIDGFSLNLTSISTALNSLTYSLLDILATGGGYLTGYNVQEGPGYITGSSGLVDYLSVTEAGDQSVSDLAATLKAEKPDSSEYKYGISYIQTGYGGTYSMLKLFKDKDVAQSTYNYIAGGDSQWTKFLREEKYGFQKGGLVPGPMDTIPAMLSPGEYIMSRGAVDSLGIGTLNSLNAGDLSALRQTGDPEVRRLLRELIVAVQTSDTEVNVYTDTKGETKAAINEFRTELRERSRRQGEKYVNVRYV
jgi:hypothetical protein